MSFGFAVGDFVVLGQLAWKVYRTCKDAPESFKNISQEVSSLHLVLKEVEETYSGATLSATQQSRLRNIGNGCRAVLEDLQGILDRYNSLGRSKRTWDRLGWGSNDIAELRSRLVSNTTLLTTFMNTSQVTVQKRLEVFLQEFRDGQHEGSLVSTQTIDSLSTNGRQAWRAIRKELEDIGISIEAFDANKDFIVDWLKTTIRTGAFEEGSAEEDGSNSILLADDSIKSSGNTEPDIVNGRPLQDGEHDANLKSTSVRPQRRKRSSQKQRLPPKGKSQSRRPPRFAALANWLFRYEEDLIKAVESQDETKVLHALEKGADVNTKNARGLTPLFRAVASGNEAVLQLLLKNGANVNEEDMRGYAVLHRAAKSGHKTVVQLLLRHGANLYQKDRRGYAALHLAAQSGHGTVVKLLLNYGAKINEEVENGYSTYMAENGYSTYMAESRGILWHTDETKGPEFYTPLRLAVISGHERVVQLLLEHGANLYQKDRLGYAALHLAAQREHGTVIKLLLNYGAKINEKVENRRLPSMMESKVDLLDIDKAEEPRFYTPLRLAVISGHESIVQLLLERGAKINEKAGGGYRALHLAAKAGQGTLVQLLLNNGAKINGKTKNGKMALHFAAELKLETMVQLLLNHGADINQHAGDMYPGGRYPRGGYTALHLAARHGHKTVVQLLLNHGVKLNEADIHERTALHLAVNWGHERVVKLLLNHGVKLNEADSHGRTALHLAVDLGNERVAKLLLNHGVDINHKDILGEDTALSLAAERGDMTVVELLLKHGAKINEKNYQGHTALGEAIRCEKPLIAKILIDAGGSE